jgi:3-dehydroquinate synthase class II
MLLVEAETPDGARHSTLLQNAETVRLVGPADGQGAPRGAWRAVSVSELRQGQTVFVLRQDEARHTGIAIQERISEK